MIHSRFFSRFNLLHFQITSIYRDNLSNLAIINAVTLKELRSLQGVQQNFGIPSKKSLYQGTFHFPYMFLTRSFLGNMDIEERDILKYLEPLPLGSNRDI